MKKWWIPWLFLLLIFGAYMIGLEEGWKNRINYEVLQCADYGRCFR